MGTTRSLKWQICFFSLHWDPDQPKHLVPQGKDLSGGSGQHLSLTAAAAANARALLPVRCKPLVPSFSQCPSVSFCARADQTAVGVSLLHLHPPEKMQHWGNEAGSLPLQPSDSWPWKLDATEWWKRNITFLRLVASERTLLFWPMKTVKQISPWGWWSSTFTHWYSILLPLCQLTSEYSHFHCDLPVPLILELPQQIPQQALPVTCHVSQLWDGKDVACATWALHTAPPLNVSADPLYISLDKTCRNDVYLLCISGLVFPRLHPTNAKHSGKSASIVFVKFNTIYKGNKWQKGTSGMTGWQTELM